jgi:hypothetical protein
MTERVSIAVLPALLTAAVSLPFAARALDRAAPIDVAATTLPRCLDQIAARSGARFIVSPELARNAPECQPVESAPSVSVALERALAHAEVGWYLRDDGVFLLAHAESAPDGRLDPLEIEDEAEPEGVPHRATRGPGPRPTVSDLATRTEIDAAELAARPQLRFNRLSRLAPNVYSNGESLSLRGVPRDNDYFTGNTVFLDGIDVGTLLLDHNLIALDELESLSYQRSVGSFEFGAGASGGAIVLRTPAPSPEPGARVSASGGMRNAWAAHAFATGALADSGVSARVAIGRRDDPRFVRSLVVPTLDDNIDRRRNAGAKLLFEPEALPELSVGLNAFRITGDAPDRSVARLRDAPFDIFGGESVDPSALPWDLEATGLGLDASWKLASGEVSLRVSDLTATRDALAEDRVQQRRLRDDREDRTRAGIDAAFDLAARWRLHVGAEFGRVESEEAQLSDVRLPPIPASPYVQRDLKSLDLDHGSLSAEIAYAGEGWRALAGVRRVEEDVAFLERRRIETENGATDIDVFLDSESDYGRTLPVAGFDYELPAGALGASWGRGYRSGGRVERGSIDEYAPERLDTAEVFWRQRWLDDRLGTRLAVFRTDWSDRTSIDGSIGAEITEPFETRIEGAELEIDYALGEQWALRGGIGWLDARHVSGAYQLPRPGLPPIPDLPLAGRRAADAPEFTAVVAVLWQGEGGWSAALDAYHADDADSTSFAPEPNRAALPAQRDAYSVVDLSVGWERGQLGIALTASNLFDEQYIDRFVDYRSFSRIIGEPRQVDLTVTWQF